VDLDRLVGRIADVDLDVLSGIPVHLSEQEAYLVLLDNEVYGESDIAAVLADHPGR